MFKTLARAMVPPEGMLIMVKAPVVRQCGNDERGIAAA
jgi:hypothetical protein